MTGIADEVAVEAVRISPFRLVTKHTLDIFLLLQIDEFGTADETPCFRPVIAHPSLLSMTTMVQYPLTSKWHAAILASLGTGVVKGS